jgi:hypothetical protein
MKAPVLKAPKVPARLKNRDSWAWHAGTLVQFWAILVIWLVSFGVLRPGHVLVIGLATVIPALVVTWKGERRRLWRKERELRHTQDNCAWLNQQLAAASQRPPPPLVTLTVQEPRIWGPPHAEADWVFVPLLVRADSPHDPGAVVIGLKMPPGIPWHTPS